MSFPLGLPRCGTRPKPRKKKTPRCPKCGYWLTWSYDEEAGFGVAWCLRTKACGWKRILD